MELDAPAGWERDSETLYLHGSGVRIERRTYRGREGWMLVPADLDRLVRVFPPTDEGLKAAFEAFGSPVSGAEGVSREVQAARDEARLEGNVDEADADADDAKDEDDD